MPEGRQRYYNNDGTPCAGGKLWTYAAGTSTPKTTWADEAGGVANPNPITLDAKGEAVIYWNGAYKVDLKQADGTQVTGYPVDNLKTDPGGFWNILANLASSAGAALVGFIASGTGAVKRDLLDRGRDTVSAFDFMTAAQIANVRAGVPTDITAAVQAALDSFAVYPGTVDLPPGNFRLGSGLTMSKRGTRLRGASKYGTYLTAADGAIFDMVRIAAQQCEVSDIIFRPASATQIPLRIYAGRAHIHDNYFLAAVNNSGTGIWLTDTNPDTGAFVPGAYNHNIVNNVIGDAGFAFATGIYEGSAQGITASHVDRNTFFSDRAVRMNKGGGNSYRDNLAQSSSGTSSVKAGVGFTFGAGVVGEKLHGNYIELYLAMVETQNADNTYQIFHAIGNHNDNCTAAVADAGAKNYVIEDTVGKVENRFGWSSRYTSTQYGVNAPGGIAGFGMDTSGNCFMGTSSGSSHTINKVGSTEGAVIATFQGAGSTVGYVQDARLGTINGAATALALNKNTSTGRTINAAGTVNAAGADYAEYMRKAAGVGTVAKGQIVGVNAQDEITDRWADAVIFAIKSTDPSYVGGDIWAEALGARPVAPSYVEPEYTGVTAGRAPFPREPLGVPEVDEVLEAEYAKALADWEAVFAQEKIDRAAYDAQLAQARADHAEAMAAWAAATAEYDAAHDAARATVDRIAFAGRVPVNVLGATPGQYIVPVQDGDGIKGIAKNEADMTLAEYMRAIGKVSAIEADGRARVFVKVG
jgi:hypothetical protein